MAQLDIQKKSSSSTLWWVIGVIVLALLAWWLISAFNGPDNDVVSAGEVTPPAAAVAPVATDELTDLGTVLSASNPAELAGRRMHLSGAMVQSVVSDRGFWVGTNENDRLFVVRTDQSAPSTPPDGAVNQGQTVNVWGTLMSMPADMSQQTTQWNLRSTDSAALAMRPLYLAVDSLTIM